MIVKNESLTLERCLNSAKNIADEIVIVDTGSSDGTKEIAKKFTDKVYDFAWCDDFSAARNFSLSKAVCDYILWLDADDVIEKEDEKIILDFKKTLDGSQDTVFLKYVLSRKENGEPDFSYYRERILKNSPNTVFVEPVHEVIVPWGNIVYCGGAITHKKEKSPPSGRNIKILENHIKNGNALSPRMEFYYAQELKDTGRTDEAIRVYEDFLDNKEGWAENKIEACLNLSGLYKQKNDERNEFFSLVRSFAYSAPRAPTACALGEFFIKSNDLPTAVYWFTSALSLKPGNDSLAFIRSDCHEFIPCLWLAYCYDKLSYPDLARHYNDLAGQFKPHDPSYLYNKEYFEKAAKI